MKSALAVISMILLVSSCTITEEASPSSSTPAGGGAGTTASTEPLRVTDYASFTDALERRGLHVRHGERAGFPGRLLDVPGQTVFIDGVPVLAFEFPTEKAFAEMRSTIRPRGDTVGQAIINWDPPHFFGAGKLLVVYFGDKAPTLAALETALGPQFAGG